MLAPEKFAVWMTGNTHVDRQLGHVYRYHSRSDVHSIALCTFVLEDLLAACPTLREQAARREVVYGYNYRYTWPATGKTKTLDLALGPPAEPVPEPAEPQPIAPSKLADVLIAVEAKSVMTEHRKSQPRVYDELSSSHEIVHQGRQDAIAGGITVVNIAATFVSPLRQRPGLPLHVSRHKQPAAAAGMVQHLRGLPLRDTVGHVGFDAYTTIVIDCDNLNEAKLWTEPPAPQPGDPDHYETFLTRVSRLYTDRFRGS